MSMEATRSEEMTQILRQVSVPLQAGREVAMKPLILAVAGIAVCAAAANAMTVAQTDTSLLNTSGYIQVIGVGEQVPDPARKPDRLYLFLKEARLRFNGHLGDTKFNLMWAAGGEDISTSNNALGLLDFSFDVPVTKASTLKVGQFLVPYSRERLTDDATLEFGDRSIQNLGFVWNRDVGAALMAHPGKLNGTVAIMTGGGRDVPQRYLPEMLGAPLVVVRGGYDTGVDEDIYTVRSRGPRPDHKVVAFYVNGLFLKDTPIGHSTVLNVRSTDKNLLTNPNWNPFMAVKPFDQSTIWQGGADFVLRTPMGSGAFNAEAEYNYAEFKNKYGTLDVRGGRVQAGISHGPGALNLRYAILVLDPRMKSTSGLPLVGSDNKPLQEITPAASYRYRSNLQIILDAPVLIDAMVFQENTVGSYVATEQPDQASVVKNGATAGTGKVIRKTVPEIRLMAQVSF
jgi:hypothetical protein